MGRILLVWLFSGVLAAMAFGQTDKEGIQQTFDEYFKTIEQKDNEKTLEYIYPKLFDHFPRERMLAAMDKMKTDTTSSITMGDAKISEISKSLKIGNTTYACIKYSFKITIIHNDTASLDFTHDLFKETYGNSNVVFDREQKKFGITASNEMFAINDPAYKGWKFLEKKGNMKPLLEKMLPAEVLKKL